MSTSLPRRSFGVMAVLLAVLAAPLLAGADTGLLSGRVSDESGGALPGVTVVNDIHLHPTQPLSARVGIVYGF